MMANRKKERNQAKLSGIITLKIQQMLDSVELLLKQNEKAFTITNMMSITDFCVAAIYLDTKLQEPEFFSLFKDYQECIP